MKKEIEEQEQNIKKQNETIEDLISITKIEEEKAKLEKYTQMMDQVKERLSQLKK